MRAVRAFAAESDAGRDLLEGALGFTPADGGWRTAGPRQEGLFLVDDAPTRRGLRGAGTVHHVAWSAPADALRPLRGRAAEAGATEVTRLIDRHYFLSVYFREHHGVLFELASPDPGFTLDEPPETLGERLTLPPPVAHLDPEVVRGLIPLPNVQRWRPDPIPS